jgi:hypothetical protein
MVEHARLREVAKALARDKSALEKQLAGREESRAAPGATVPADPASRAEVAGATGRVSAPLDHSPEHR